ncbi:hypothetical protein TGPRC2_269100 [Toxoplasma gondii TgCatPRC2]|uniref:Uncharacterized protein n=3 Tax=Toxoplasma gondii TaxID=5811 RepID=A0A151HNE3_TOXGO|nr:hypothetical protein TGARI_269100 [Toxoplasma gondii ARI]KYK70895.1 hypothetical protein TGPRC2_269100 [Toxoplasma gondii TgCatPRC2]PIM01042.1 hypothetical protein TGCOUG_269100 [Toxoplasma gondii COUG]
MGYTCRVLCSATQSSFVTCAQHSRGKRPNQLTHHAAMEINLLGSFFCSVTAFQGILTFVRSYASHTCWLAPTNLAALKEPVVLAPQASSDIPRAVQEVLNCCIGGFSAVFEALLSPGAGDDGLRFLCFLLFSPSAWSTWSQTPLGVCRTSVTNSRLCSRKQWTSRTSDGDWPFLPCRGAGNATPRARGQRCGSSKELLLASAACSCAAVAVLVASRIQQSIYRLFFPSCQRQTFVRVGGLNLTLHDHVIPRRATEVPSTLVSSQGNWERLRDGGRAFRVRHRTEVAGFSLPATRRRISRACSSHDHHSSISLRQDAPSHHAGRLGFVHVPIPLSPEQAPGDQATTGGSYATRSRSAEVLLPYRCCRSVEQQVDHFFFLLVLILTPAMNHAKNLLAIAKICLATVQGKGEKNVTGLGHSKGASQKGPPRRQHRDGALSTAAPANAANGCNQSTFSETKEDPHSARKEVAVPMGAGVRYTDYKWASRRLVSTSGGHQCRKHCLKALRRCLHQASVTEHGTIVLLTQLPLQSFLHWLFPNHGTQVPHFSRRRSVPPKRGGMPLTLAFQRRRNSVEAEVRGTRRTVEVVDASGEPCDATLNTQGVSSCGEQATNTAPEGGESQEMLSLHRDNNRKQDRCGNTAADPNPVRLTAVEHMRGVDRIGYLCCLLQHCKDPDTVYRVARHHPGRHQPLLMPAASQCSFTFRKAR